MTTTKIETRPTHGVVPGVAHLALDLADRGQSTAIAVLQDARVELKAVFDPRGGQWANGHYVPSLLAAIGDIIERHLVAIGFKPPREKPDLSEKARAVAIAVGDTPARPCPRCSSPSLIRQENCDSCIACGYSRCS